MWAEDRPYILRFLFTDCRGGTNMITSLALAGRSCVGTAQWFWYTGRAGPLAHLERSWPFIVSAVDWSMGADNIHMDRVLDSQVTASATAVPCTWTILQMHPKQTKYMRRFQPQLRNLDAVRCRVCSFSVLVKATGRSGGTRQKGRTKKLTWRDVVAREI